MWLALVTLSVMLLGTVFLRVFGRQVAAILEDWTRDARRGARSKAPWGNGRA